jgi:hypothetical protein
MNDMETMMSSTDALPDSTLARQFDRVREKWPQAMLTAYSGQGCAVLSVPDVEPLHADALSRPNVTVAVILPYGYPQASPDLFYVQGDLRLAHGGSIRWTSADAPFGFQRIHNRMAMWRPNSDDLVTIVNYLRVALGRMALRA